MFNWVHTKFHYNPLKAESTQNERRKNTECMRKEGKREGLAKQIDEMVDILEDWRMKNGGVKVLVVGFERLSKPINYRAEYFNLKKEGKRDEVFVVDNDDDDDELSPLMATRFQNNFDDSGEFCSAFEKSQVVVAMERHVAQRIRRRVTLADLFRADADGKPKPPPPEKVAAQDLQKKLPEVETADDDGRCFANKPKVAAQPPAKTLRRLMRKMLKKKIHAEVENEQLVGERRLMNDAELYGKVFESTSLCPIQAASA